MAMMRFTTTRLNGLRAAGRLAELQHAVIAPFLARELGPRFERLFAEFEPEGTDKRAWYTNAVARPLRVADLPAADGEAVRATTAAMLDDLRALVGRLAADTPQKASLARILLAVAVFPPDDLWCDGDQPIIVNWGFEREDAQDIDRPRAITALAMPAPARPTRATQRDRAAVAATRSRWAMQSATPLLWLLFVLLTLAIDRMLLPACGIDGRWVAAAPWRFLDFCRVPSGNAEAAEGARLQAMVRQAELDVALQRRTCMAPAAANDTPSPIGQEIERRLPASAPRGNVEIALLWDNHADLDLAVMCPSGDRLWQASPGLQACGGRLLEDINKSGRPMTDHPIEQAAWDHPSPGTYTVQVILYGYNDVPDVTDIPYTIRLRQGADERLFQGHVKGAHTTVTGATVTF